MRRIFRISVILIFILVIFSVVISGLKPDPGTIMSAGDVASCLDDTLAYENTRGAMQLIGLSAEYRPLMVKALESRHKKVRLHGIVALGVIGDEESVRLLSDYIYDVQGNRDLLIATAEALSRARADSAIPILNEILVSQKDKEVQKYLSRAIRRIETPGYDYPLLNVRYGRIFTNFLVEDIEHVYFDPMWESDYRENNPYYFSNEEWKQLFTLIRDADICGPGPYGVNSSLFILLKDGREARIFGNDHSSFNYVNDTYFTHLYHEHLCFNSEKLEEFLRDCMRTE